MQILNNPFTSEKKVSDVFNILITSRAVSITFTKFHSLGSIPNNFMQNKPKQTNIFKGGRESFQGFEPTRMNIPRTFLFAYEFSERGDWSNGAHGGEKIEYSI